MTLQSGAPAPALLKALETAGWGDLAGHDLRGVRVVLSALVRALPAKSGQGYSTAEQLAAASGYSTRWVRRCLHFLEDLELVDWHRGGVHNGRPQPSYFRVDKTVLLALVQIARSARDQALAALRETTRARIDGLRMLYVKSKAQQNRRSHHAELSTSLPPIGEGSGPTARPDTPARGDRARPEQAQRHIAAARAALAALKATTRGKAATR